MAKYNAVIFDFDGTLVDSSLGIFRSLQYAFKADDKPEPPFPDLKCFVGPPLADSFKKFYGYDDENAIRMVKKYRERYSKVGYLEAHVYDGIEDLLKSLKSENIKIAIASSKPQIFVKKILDEFNLSGYFDYIGGIEINKKELSKTQIISLALENVCANSQTKAVMVGDRCFDIDGAKNNQLPSIAVLYGFGSEDEFLKHGATHIAKTTADVKKIILED